MRRHRPSVRPRTLLTGVLAAALLAAGGAAVPAEAASTFPFAVDSVTAVPGAQPDQVLVTWQGGGRATKVAVIGGSTPGIDAHPFHSAWYPASTRQIVLTVPKRLRPWLGGGSGNPVWIKVVQSNSSWTKFRPMSVVDRSYRVTPAGHWTYARGPLPAVTAGSTTAAATGTEPVVAPSRLRVAELNVQSLTATKSYSAVNRWKARAPRVAAAITAAKPDLLLTAELTTNKVDGCTDHPNKGLPYVCRGHSQLGSLQKLLPTLKLADADAYDRAMDRTREAGGKSMTSGEHVFYDPAKLTVLDHGFLAPATRRGDHSIPGVQGLGVTGWSGTNALGPDRWLSWVKFETTDAAHRTFFAVAAHFPAGLSDAVVAGRVRESAAVRAAIDALAGDAPVVLAGDLNSDPLLDRSAPQVDFVRDGWFDAASVVGTSTTGKDLRGTIRFATANDDRGAKGDFGYPSRPTPRVYQGGRIDYILLKNSPYSYAYRNVLKLHPDGSFVQRLRGTDHNVQLADIGIGGPVGTAAPAPGS